MSKSKSVKIPRELLELLEKRKPVDDRAPGEQLLEIVRDYMELEKFADAMCEQVDGLEDATISEVIMKYITGGKERMINMQKSLDELKTMIQGLQTFFTKVKGRS